MAKIKVYNIKGEELKEIDLNPKFFEIKLVPAVIQQVVVAAQANQRHILAHTMDRSDVAGGGKKPWKQKGTGRARHGSIRSPLWVGGGITFGPRNTRNFTQKINKQVRRKALFMALSDRAVATQITVVDDFAVKTFQTKQIVALLKNFKLTKSTLLVDDKLSKEFVKSAGNLSRVEVIAARNLNVETVLKHVNLLFSEAALAALDQVFTKK
jgi:large subunit ribosomal protein L4